ncbi:hypothetical protein TNCV_4122521 [Trichonephila clavipes]|nr:hypothetical protein TNCV_4122521 [Trichonephila clavipes]
MRRLTVVMVTIVPDFFKDCDDVTKLITNPVRDRIAIVFCYTRAFGEDLVILNHDQVTRLTSELATSIPNYPTPPRGGRLSFNRFKFTCGNCGDGDRGRIAMPSIVPSGNFTELKSYCHLYGAQGQRQAYLLPMPR